MADSLRATDVEARAEGIVCLYGALDPTDETAAHLVQTFGTSGKTSVSPLM